MATGVAALAFALVAGARCPLGKLQRKHFSLSWMLRTPQSSRWQSQPAAQAARSISSLRALRLRLRPSWTLWFKGTSSGKGGRAGSSEGPPVPAAGAPAGAVTGPATSGTEEEAAPRVGEGVWTRGVHPTSPTALLRPHTAPRQWLLQKGRGSCPGAA